MTVQIKKSLADLFPDFAGMAAAHAVAMRQWRAHQVRVKEDAAKEDLDPLKKHWPLPRPDAHPLIESAVNENDDMDFEIEDDGPSPEDVLALRKVQLLGDVTRAEQAATAAILPSAKVRLFNIRERDIRAEDAKIVQDLNLKNLGFMNSVAVATGLKKKIAPEDIAKAVNENRSDEDQAHLADMKARRVKIAAIERRAAQAHADVEDLTADTIDAFQIPDFTKD